MARRPRAEAPALLVSVRLSPAERARVVEAARVNQQPFSEYCRDLLVCGAEDSLESRFVIQNPKQTAH